MERVHISANAHPSNTDPGKINRNQLLLRRTLFTNGGALSRASMLCLCAAIRQLYPLALVEGTRRAAKAFNGSETIVFLLFRCQQLNVLLCRGCDKVFKTRNRNFCVCADKNITSIGVSRPLPLHAFGYLFGNPQPIVSTSFVWAECEIPYTNGYVVHDNYTQNTVN